MLGEGSPARAWTSAALSVACHILVILGIVNSAVLAELGYPPEPPRTRFAYRVLELTVPEPLPSPFRREPPAAAKNKSKDAGKTVVSREQLAAITPPPALPAAKPDVPPLVQQPPIPGPPPRRIFRPPTPRAIAEAPDPKQILIQDAPRIEDLDRIQAPTMTVLGTLVNQNPLIRPPDQLTLPREVAVVPLPLDLLGKQKSELAARAPPVDQPKFALPAAARRAPLEGSAVEDPPPLVSTLSGSDSQAIKLISQSSHPIPLAPSMAVPKASTGPALVSGGTVNEGRVTPTAPPTAPPLQTPGAGGAARGGEGAGTSQSELVKLQREGKPDVVLTQSESAIPGSAGLLRCRPVFSVFIALETPRDWVLQFCLPVDSGTEAQAPQQRNGNIVELVEVTPLAPPFATLIMRPKVTFRPGMRYEFVHGYVTELGRFEQMREVGQSAIKGIEYILDALSQWEFMPARKDGIPARVEVLLCIPNGG